MSELCCKQSRKYRVAVRDCKDGQMKSILVSEENYRKIQKAIRDASGATLLLKDANEK